MLYTKPLARLIEELEKLPGIGPKSSQRLAFHLIKQPTQAVENLANALVDAKRTVRFCSSCQNLSADDPCDLCRSPISCPSIPASCLKKSCRHRNC